MLITPKLTVDGGLMSKKSIHSFIFDFETTILLTAAFLAILKVQALHTLNVLVNLTLMAFPVACVIFF